MDIWLMRADQEIGGAQKFINEKCVYLTFVGLNRNLDKYDTVEQLQDEISELYSDMKTGPIRRRTLIKWSKQIWSFKHDMQPNDWISIFHKSKDALVIGKIRSNYLYIPEGPDPFFHRRLVDWFDREIPSSLFTNDVKSMMDRYLLLYKASCDFSLSLLNNLSTPE